MRRVLILTFVLYGVAFADMPKNKIVGVFGYKLGDKLELTAEMKKQLDSGNNVFIVNPPKKVRDLNLYSVIITPTTNKIYAINGGQRFEDNNQCLIELNVFRNTLARSMGSLKSRI